MFVGANKKLLNLKFFQVGLPTIAYFNLVTRMALNSKFSYANFNIVYFECVKIVKNRIKHTYQKVVNRFQLNLINENYEN